MKKRNNNTYIVLGVLGAAIFGGIAMSKQFQPAVGNADEMMEIYEARNKAEMERRAKSERPTTAKSALGDRMKGALDETPRVTAATPLGPDGKPAKKEWVSILVANRPYKANQAIVNDSAPSNQWYNKDARQPGNQSMVEGNE